MKKNLVISLLMMVLIVFGAQITLAQKTKSGATKTQLVDRLVELTMTGFPIVEMEKSYLAKITELTEKDNQDNEEIIISVVENNADISGDQKDFLKINMAQLVRDLGNRINSALVKDLKFGEWAEQSLKKHYSLKYSVADLNRAITFCESDSGQAMLAGLSLDLAALAETSDKPTDIPMDEATAGFIDSPIGKKFIGIVFENVTKDVYAKSIPTKKEQAVSVEKILIIASGEKVKAMLIEFLKVNFGH